MVTFFLRLILCAALVAMLPATAGAASLPSYAKAADEESIHGTIAAVTGKYTLRVHDSRGFVDSVRLHQGTVINPTGLTLQQGMQVTVYGHAEGNVFAANEIDTPYQAAVAYLPPYPYPYPPYWGGYPGWGWGYHYWR